jgi:hypothetical protein
MPDFEFTSPGGKKYTVTGPAGSTPEQAFQMLQTQLGAAQTDAAPVSDVSALGHRIMSDVNQANHEEGKATLGLGETALNAVTGVGSSIAGGFKGYWDTVAAIANGQSLDDAIATGARSVQKTQQDYTYQPRTGIGKLGTELLSSPLVLAKAGTQAAGGAIGGALNGEQGRIAGEAIGNVAPDVAATLLGGRAAMRGPTRAPIIEQAPAAVDYDIPAYQRNGVKPVPEIAGPVAPPAMIGPPAPAPEPVIAPPAAPVPTLPPSIPGPVMRSPIESYAAAPTASPFVPLSEPVLPEVAAPTALDAYAAKGEQPAGPTVPRNQFDDILRENPVQAAPKSPLESMIAGEPAVARITAGLRDTSDIDQILHEFGVNSSDPVTVPTLPIETVERASAPIAPIDATMRAPERIPGPSLPAESVERATAPAAPLDSSMVAPEPIAGPGRASEVAKPPEEFVATPERHVDPANREQNLQALRDVGLGNIRESAITGNAAQAAREFQHGKITSEPAGQLWFDQFQAETDAMKNHAQRIVDNTGGRTGLDESALTRKGMDIAAPYDAARGYFESAKKSLYDIAEQRAKESGVPVATESVDALLADPDFRATLMAKDQQGLLSTIESQYARFKALDDGSLSVANAEKFRKWLNKVWSPDKSGTLGEVKGALDQDVFKSAGADVYAEGRKMHILEKQTLDNPNGIAKLMDSDPNTPINRNTAYEKIPDKIMTLSEDQFKHIIDTYRDLPPELQPLAQQAIATLKAHYAEKMLDAGAESGRGNPRQLWNAGGVRTLVSDNSAKIPLIFDLDELKRIDQMLKAGEVLRVNPAYPGAAAQLANANKAGLMSTLLGRAGGGIGGLTGAAVAGPFGAGAGGLLGEAISSKLVRHAGERKALEEAKRAIINEHRDTPKPRSPIDEWEEGLR